MPRWLQEQRTRALAGRNNRYHSASWFGRHVTRKLSPYVTWLLLRLGISANQTTLLRLILALVIAPMFLQPQPAWWIAAALACYLRIILDCVDGELARLRDAASPQGTYLDEFVDMASEGVLLSGMALGLYRMLGFHAVAFGLAAVVLASLTRSHLHLLRSTAFEWGVPAPARDSAPPQAPRWLRRARTASKVLLMTPGLHYLPQLVTASVLDLFIQPFSLFGLAWNARLIWLALFATGLLLATVTRVSHTVRHGLQSQL